MAYAYYVPLVVQSGQVTGSVTDFVALLDHTFAPWKSVGNGGHIINTQFGFPADWNVYSDSGLTTPIDFELIEWDATTGYILGWINTTVATSTTVYIGYGDGSQTLYQGDTLDTWSGIGFGAVYHMDILGVSPAFWFDSIATKHLTNTNGTQVAGKVADAGSFTGGNSYARYSSTVVTATPLTFSCWVNFDGSDEGFPISVTNTAGAAAGFYLYLYSNGDIAAGTATGGVTFSESIKSGGVPTNTWTHVAGVISSATSRIAYANAVAATTDTTNTTPALTPDNLTVNGAIANNSNTGLLNSTTDEVRIHNVARNAAWLEAEYHSQNNAPAFWVLGSEVPVGGSIWSPYISPFGWH